jgi:hypothetical protein
MTESDKLARLSQEELELVNRSGRTRANPAPASPILVSRTKTLNRYPTSANVYYACEALSVFGDEVEGTAGSFTTYGSTYFALNLGKSIPPNGSVILATFVGSRWVFRYDG